MGLKKKGKSFIIDLVIYPFNILVSIAETSDERHKSLDRYSWTPKGLEEIQGIINIEETCNGRVIMTSCNRTILVLRHYPTMPAYRGYLAHEVFHVVSIILDRTGHKLSIGKSDESYAYLIDYVTRKIYEKLK